MSNCVSISKQSFSFNEKLIVYYRNLGQLGDIPSGVSQLYKELVAANPAKRPNPKEKLEAMRRSGGYFKNELIDAIVFLEELQIKEESEKGRFYQNIGSLLDNFPRHVGTRKILPELIKAFEFSNAGAAILGPVLKLGKGMSDEEYVRRIVPCIVKLFASSDRNARYKLLNQVETFVEHLDAKVVNEQVFPQLQSGFVDQGCWKSIELEKLPLLQIFRPLVENTEN